MKSINFNAGIREYAINGDENNVIRVNIMDLNLESRMRRAGDAIDTIIRSYGDKKLNAEERVEIDARIREEVNAAFGTDVCTPAFGDTNCLTVVDEDGTRLFMAFFSEFIRIIKADIEAMRPKAAAPAISPKAQQYISTAPSAAPVAALANPYGNVPDVSSMSKEQKLQLMAQLMQG